MVMITFTIDSIGYHPGTAVALILTGMDDSLSGRFTHGLVSRPSSQNIPLDENSLTHSSRAAERYSRRHTIPAHEAILLPSQENFL